jgi:hypothetical protein
LCKIPVAQEVILQFTTWVATTIYFQRTLLQPGLCDMHPESSSFAVAVGYLLLQVFVHIVIVMQWERGDREQFIRTLAAVGAEEDYRQLLENLYPPQVSTLFQLCNHSAGIPKKLCDVFAGCAPARLESTCHAPPAQESRNNVVRSCRFYIAFSVARTRKALLADELVISIL